MDKAPEDRPESRESSSNFLYDIIAEDLRTGRHRKIVTRFPPEPNGYLHIGHTKAICLNFGIKRDFDGRCNLRFDDTNPETEELEYVESIQESVRWLGFEWDELRYASDYFEQFYAYAVKLVRKGLAYVDSLNDEQIREYRGTVTEPGRPSPDRNRSVEENLDLFARMKAGEFDEGAYVLRARADLSSPNMKMRDPLLYRVRHAKHYHLAADWHIFPFYDFAHPLEDAIEGVTHSLCTLEFDNNRELYDWVLENCLEPEELPVRPHQYEFSRLNLDYTVMSKRKLLQLVNEGYVAGWDDPRMPTVFGLRRRGVTPEAVRSFNDRVGVTKADQWITPDLLDHSIRDDLNLKAPRVMAVLNPLKVVITNYPEGTVEWLDAPYWPHDVPREGTRRIPFGRTLYIERDDFMEEPPRKFFRLAPGREVRLRYGYFITCQEVIRDAAGQIVELRCTYDPQTRGGDAPDGRSPKGTLHWVSAAESLPCEVRLYDLLFSVPRPDDEPGDWKQYLNPDSLRVLDNARVEPSVTGDPADTRYQFERQGYFWRDPSDSRPEALVFNRIVGLKDSWARAGQSSTGAAASTIAGAAAGAKTPAAGQQEKAKASVPAVDPADRLTPEARAQYDDLRARYGIGAEEAIVIARETDLIAFFEGALSADTKPSSVAAWVTHEIVPLLGPGGVGALALQPAQLAELVALVDSEQITSRVGREVLAEALRTGVDPATLVRDRGLSALNDPAEVRRVVEEVVAAHPDKAAAVRSGRTGLTGFFVGQVMKATDGRANPKLVQDLVVDVIG